MNTILVISKDQTIRSFTRSQERNRTICLVFHISYTLWSYLMSLELINYHMICHTVKSSGGWAISLIEWIPPVDTIRTQKLWIEVSIEYCFQHKYLCFNRKSKFGVCIDWTLYLNDLINKSINDIVLYIDMSFFFTWWEIKIQDIIRTRWCC